MTEFIVDLDSKRSVALGLAFVEEMRGGDFVRGEIVRCRDCKHGYEDKRDTALGWVEAFVCVSEQWSTSSLMPSHKVKPDGFCAWAERKEGGE